MDKIRIAVSSVIGYASAALFNGILVVIKETNTGVFNWLKTTFGHHWIGQGVLTILVFALVTLITMSAYKGNELTDKLSTKLVITTIISTLLSVFIITGFYITHL